VTLETWGSAAAIVAASLLLGYGVNAVGIRCRAAAPAVGLGLLIIISYVAIQAPGGVTTAAVTDTLLTTLAAGSLARRCRSFRVRFASTCAGALGAAGAAIPFIANGRVGLLGVSLDNDTANHLIWAQALESSKARQIYGLPNYYPLGPHALADVVSNLLGARLDLAFTGLLIAGVVLTAVVGANALGGETGWKRVITGVLAALLYLEAAYYAEGAFKEQLLGLLLIAFVLQLEAVRDQWTDGLGIRWRFLAPTAILAAAALYTYGYPGIVWFALTAVIWLAAELMLRWAGWRVILRPPPSRIPRAQWAVWVAKLRLVLPAVAITTALLAVLSAPVARRNIALFDLFGASPAGTGAISLANLGNLAHQLPAPEGFGVWNSIDFRFDPSNVFHAGELAALAMGVFILGFLCVLARRELVLAAAAAACAIVYWRASNQSPYVLAKALVVAGPVIAVIDMRGLLRLEGRRVSVQLVSLAVAAAFLALAAHSSFQTLRNEPVWPNESTAELTSLAGETRGQNVVDLVTTDYAEWLFHDSYMSSIADNTINLAQIGPRPNKPFVYGTGTDFDSINFALLPRFTWVVTSNSPYASQPPDSFVLIRKLRLYELWKRVQRSVPSRQVIEKPGEPGAVLDCRSAAGRAISRHPGMAAVMSKPVIVPLGFIGAGAAETVKVPLPRGTWALSLQYTSATVLEITVRQRTWRMPAYLDRPGPWFIVGNVTSTGAPATLTIHADQPASFTGPSLGAAPTAIAATRVPDTRALIPLRRACGRYVDWYRF